MSLAELREILIRDVVASAQALVGAELVKGPMRARIVETEAYRGSDDPASHAFRGPTPRTQVMFGEPGLAYVYFNYGVHWMLNVTTYSSGQAGAVLIWAAQPLAGLEEMRANRSCGRDEDLLSGPGKLARAFGLTGADNFIDLLALDSLLRLVPREGDVRLVTGVRVGIAQGKAHDRPWRFLDADRLGWASRPRPAS